MIDDLTFTQAVWLFCPAFVLHVLEEWPRFTGWARLHASARFTQRDYNVTHAAGVATSLLAALIVSRFPNRTVVFIFFAFVFTPAVLFNTLFHLGASGVFHAWEVGHNASKRGDLAPISRNKHAPRRINRANRRSSNEHFQNQYWFRRPA